MSVSGFNEAMPIAPLKIASLGNLKELGEKVDKIIVERRKKAILNKEKPPFKMAGYDSDTYLVKFDCPRLRTGEGKGVIGESIRGADLFIIADVINYDRMYELHGEMSYMSPDDYFLDLKRVIMACSGQARRITVIMPYLYEGRRHIKILDESLDCAQALQELVSMGVETIVTFDAHDKRVQNAVPNSGFDNFFTSYQFISTFLKRHPDIAADKSRLMIASPDEGGMRRAVYYAGLLGVDVGMFYKKSGSSLTPSDDAKSPMEFLGNSPAGRDVVIVDDMIATGRTVLEAAREIRKRNARRVVICATFGLFSNGLDDFDRAYKDRVFDEIYTTNLCHNPKELKDKKYCHMVDMSRYIALIIDTLNHDTSVNEIIDATERIRSLLANGQRL